MSSGNKGPENSIVPEQKSDDAEANTLSLLEKIQKRSISPSAISKEQRRQLVSYLMADGYSTAEIARVLEVADRTILRDKKIISKANAIEHNPKMVGEKVGQLEQTVAQVMQRLRRIAKAPGTPPAVRVEAERGVWKTQRELVETLQKLGYLPTAAQRIEADFMHRLEEPPTYEQMLVSVGHLEPLFLDVPESDKGAAREFEEVKDMLSRFSVSEKLSNISENIEKEFNNGVNNEE